MSDIDFENLSNAQLAVVVAAIKGSFDEDQLDMMLAERLDERHLAGLGPWPDRVFEIVKECQKKGLIRRLVEAIEMERPLAKGIKDLRTQLSRLQNAMSNIPIRVPIHFMGRDDALAAIESDLQRSEGRVAITALRGIRGVGKSTLAAAYAERHRRNYRATWWIRAQSETGIRADLNALGVRLNWVTADEKEEPALAVVVERLRHEGEGILLIFDNAPDANTVMPYLPPVGHAQVIITSTAHALGSIVKPVEIGLWPVGTGADYLLVRTGRTSEREAALALSGLLGGLPLAHEQAAAYCDHVEISLASYRTRFETEPLLDTDYHNGLTVAKTFALAIEEAGECYPASKDLIIHAAALPPEPIPLFLFREGRERFGEPLASALADGGLDKVVTTLRALALVERETIADERDPAITTDCIRLHRLVRQVAAARCEDDSREDARCALVHALAAVYPLDVFDNSSTWPRVRRLDRLVLALVGGNAELPKGAEHQAANLMSRLASYRHSAFEAAHAEARPLFERALAIHEKVLGPEHPTTMTTLNNFALLLLEQGNVAGARPLFERVLAVHEKVGDLEDQGGAASLNNLAALMVDKGDLAAAQPIFERVLAIYEKTHGPEHPHVARSLNNLAFLLRQRADSVGARPLFERALAIYEKVPGPEPADVALVLSNIASLLQDQGDLVGARPLFERALAIREKVFGPQHPKTAMNLSDLGALLKDLGDLPEARKVLERARVIYETTNGSEQPDMAAALNLLAHVLHMQRDLPEARSLFERALAIYEKVRGPEHRDTAANLHNLAYLLKDQGDLTGARLHCERALTICETSLGPEHELTGNVLRMLASLARDQGDLSGARLLCERALTNREKVYGPEHPETAKDLNNLARVRQEQGDVEGARPLFERALTISEKALGPEHPDTAVILSNLGALLNELGQVQEAEPLFRRAIAIAEKVMGPKHSDTQRYRSRFARLLLDTGRKEEALVNAEAALAEHEAQLGVNHVWTRTSACVTADALEELGRTDDAKALRTLYGIERKDVGT